MELEFKCGTRLLKVEAPDQNVMGVLLPSDPTTGENSPEEEERIVRKALAEPIGSPRLREIVRPGEKIAIISSDITRPMPTYRVMPALLDELYEAGVDPADITLVFALGIHRGHTEEERRKLAGERAFSEIRCVDCNRDDMVRIGTTEKGTPVDVTRVVAEADRRICLGNIEYHYFAGYSGGGKAIMPGVSSHDAIQHNHSMMVDENACAGKIAGNPVREDIEASAALCGVDFILNVVLDSHKKIVCAVAGDMIQAHRAGCAFLDTLYLQRIPERADIVLVSQGGAPKDMNLYQTQKALDNAKHAVKDGGVVILIGSCHEGFGEDVFEEWLTSAETADSLIERLHREFRLGGHKAAAIAMVMRHADVYLVSDLEPDLVKRIFMTPFSTAQAALDAALKKLGPEATILAMPYGGSTLPRAEK